MDGDLNDVRRELGEMHALANRTHNGLLTLATTLKDVVARQDRYERGLNVSSFVAYVVFTVLLGGGFYVLYKSRMANLGEAQEEAGKARAAAQADAESARREVAARDAGSKLAGELLALARDGKRDELLARMGELATARVSLVEKQVVEEAAARLRSEMVDKAFTAGLEAARTNQWKKAIVELRKALGHETESARAVQARYHLGVALLKEGDGEAAARELDVALQGGAERNAPELRYYLASALELGKQPERARLEFTKFADTRPLHPWAQLARRKAGILARLKIATPATNP